MRASLFVWKCRCPCCSATGSHPGTSQGWSLIPPSCLCNCAPVCIGSSWESSVEEVMPTGTGLTWDGGKDIPSPPSQCFMFQDQVWMFLTSLNCGRLSITLHIFWSHQNSSECHTWRFSISTGTASAPGACSALSKQRSATWLNHL